MNKEKAERLHPLLVAMFPGHKVTMYSSSEETIWWFAVNDGKGHVLHVWDCDHADTNPPRLGC